MGTRDKMAVMGEAESSDYVLSMLYGSLRELVHMLFQKWEFLFSGETTHTKEWNSHRPRHCFI